MSTQSRPIRRLAPKVLLAGAFALCLPATFVLIADEPDATTQPATQPTTRPKDAAARKEDEINRVMAFFKETQPDVYEQALALKATDPQRFENQIHAASGKVRKLEDLHKRSPKLFAISMQELEASYRCIRTARELKRTDLPPAERDRLTKDLNDQVAADFELCQKYRQQEIDDISQKLTDLSKQIQDREQEKTDLIKKRVDDLIQNPPRPDW